MNKRTIKESLFVYGPGILLAIFGFLFAWRYVDPAPPYKIVLGTGSKESDYYDIGSRLAERLAGRGLEVVIKETAGSSANLGLLESSKVDIAFVQGGITPGFEEPVLKALGSMYLEPLWLLRWESDEPVQRLSDLKGKKLSIGAAGSGTRTLCLALLKECQVDTENELLELGAGAAVEALLNRELDGVFLVAPPKSVHLRKALATPGVELMDFRRSTALARLHPILEEVLVPEGSLEMALNLPKQPVHLVCPAATLVVRDDFHPALVGVVLAAAREVVGKPGILSDRDQFPSPEFCSFELREEAKIFYKRGASFLYRHLPFRLAATLDRMVIMLLPFLTLLIPLAKILPAIFDWRMRSKINKQYGALLRLETRLGSSPAEELREEMEELEQRVEGLLTMPASYGADVHHLQVHLKTVKAKLEKMD